MRSVGIRELKNHLSEYVRQVRAGERLLVTDRGRVVAELRQPVDPALEGEPFPELTRRIREGSVSAAAQNDPARYPRMEPVLPSGRAAELLDEARGER